MAAKRRSRSVTTGQEPIIRRRARQHEPEPADEDAPETVDEDEPEAVYEDEPEAVYEDEPEAVDEDEPEAVDEELEAVDEDELPDDRRRSSSGRPTRQGTRTARQGTRTAHRNKLTLTAGEAVKSALREVAEFTGKQAEGITDVERTEDGWKIGIEVLEDRRIPSSADILATYEATIDGNGELISYRRVRRYPRGRGTEVI
jgi:hypothetical protein